MSIHSENLIEDDEGAVRLLAKVARELPDNDTDRVQCFVSRFFQVALTTRMGAVLDPYTAVDMARGMVAVANLIPLSLWRDQVRVDVTYFSNVLWQSRPPQMSIRALLVDRRGGPGRDTETLLEAPPALVEELKKVFRSAAPRGIAAEPRIIVATAARRWA